MDPHAHPPSGWSGDFGDGGVAAGGHSGIVQGEPHLRKEGMRLVLGTSAALTSSTSAYRALWSGPFIKLVNILAEFVSPPKVNICAEFNFNLTSSCLQRLPCLCVCVYVCFPTDRCPWGGV